MIFRSLAFTAVLLSTTFTAQAQDFEPYAGVGVGMFGLELKTSTVSQKNNVFGGFAKAGINFNQYIAAELRFGATGQGTTSYPIGTPLKIPAGIIVPSPSAFDFSMQAEYFLSYFIKPQYELGKGFKIYGLLGGTTVKITSRSSIAAIPASSGSITGISYGVGAEYQLAERINIGSEWVQYWRDVNIGTSSKARIWGIVGTINYAF